MIFGTAIDVFCSQVYRSEWTHDMRVVVVTSVAETVLVNIFLQCVESVQYTDDRRASSAPIRARCDVLRCSSRQRGSHWHHKTLVALAPHLHSRSTLRQKQGAFPCHYNLRKYNSIHLAWELQLYGTAYRSLSLLPLDKNLNTIGKQNYQEPGVEAELNFEFF